MHLLDEAGLDRRDQRRVRVQREMRADPALEAELLGISRQQQLDRRGVEADAVVEAQHAVWLVDAADRQHGGEDLRLGDLCRIAREERLDVEGLGRFHHVVDAVARHVDAGQLVDDGVDLRDDDALLERRRLDHDGRVLGVRPHVEVAVFVGLPRHRERHLGRQVDEVAPEQLDVGVDRAELDLSGVECARHRRALRAGVGVVELLGDALGEEVEVLGEHDAGLHDVDVVQHLGVGLDKGPRQEVGLLLVVTLETKAVARLENGFEQLGDIPRRHDLALGETRPRFEPLGSVGLLLSPVGHHVSCLAA